MKKATRKSVADVVKSVRRSKTMVSAPINKEFYKGALWGMQLLLRHQRLMERHSA